MRLSNKFILNCKISKQNELSYDMLLIIVQTQRTDSNILLSNFFCCRGKQLNKPFCPPFSPLGLEMDSSLVQLGQTDASMSLGYVDTRCISLS